MPDNNPKYVQAAHPGIEWNDETRWILGRSAAYCAPIAGSLRLRGDDIPPTAEADQAAVIYWMLQMYEKYGASGRDWKKLGDAELNQIGREAHERDKEGAAPTEGAS